MNIQNFETVHGNTTAKNEYQSKAALINQVYSKFPKHLGFPRARARICAERSCYA